jgi:hypothetical protein
VRHAGGVGVRVVQRGARVVKVEGARRASVAERVDVGVARRGGGVGRVADVRGETVRRWETWGGTVRMAPHGEHALCGCRPASA